MSMYTLQAKVLCLYVVCEGSHNLSIDLVSLVHLYMVYLFNEIRLECGSPYLVLKRKK
jgi:hypothetical protein